MEIEELDLGESVWGEFGGVEKEETIVRIYHMREESILKKNINIYPKNNPKHNTGSNILG